MPPVLLQCPMAVFDPQFQKVVFFQTPPRLPSRSNNSQGKAGCSDRLVSTERRTHEIFDKYSVTFCTQCPLMMTKEQVFIFMDVITKIHESITESCKNFWSDVTFVYHFVISRPEVFLITRYELCSVGPTFEHKKTGRGTGHSSTPYWPFDKVNECRWFVCRSAVRQFCTSDDWPSSGMLHHAVS